MQLFTIGLYQLNTDGTQVLIDGKPKETYTIDDIVQYSKAWTGFSGRYKRGGTSTSDRHGDDSLDPMMIREEWRDLFPKNDLHGGFIGDRVVPLCVDLPSKHYMKKGAEYRLLGPSPRPELHADNYGWGAETSRITLDTGSPLFNKLCSPDSNMDCTYPSKVVLDENLADNIGDVDTLRTVALKSGSTPIYYGK